jgi:hypothetical protein
MTREDMAKLAQARAQGAPAAVDPCRVYDAKGTYIYISEDVPELDMCRPCAEKIIERRGAKGDQIETFIGGELADAIHHCGGCEVPLLDTLTRSGALDELEHWERYGTPNTPSEWAEFDRMVEGIADEHLPRVEKLLASQGGAT